MERPIVLCGLGRMGTRILEYLHAAGLPVVVVDNRCQADDPRLQGTRLVCGDCRQRAVLEAADVANARGVLILTNDDLVNISTTLMVRAINPRGSRGPAHVQPELAHSARVERCTTSSP